MDEIIARAMRSALFFVSACLLMWVFVPDGRTIAAGLVLGASASLMNALLLKRRIEFVSKTVADQGVRRMGLGGASRLATVLLAVMIALKFPGRFDLPSTLVACFYVQLAVFVTAIIQNKKNVNGKG
ncbi:ATP synthase subunit I [Paenibacillus tarimensis]